MDSQEKLLEFFTEPLQELKETVKHEKELQRKLAEKFSEYMEASDKNLQQLDSNDQKLVEMLNNRANSCEIETKRVEQRVNALENMNKNNEKLADSLKLLSSDYELLKLKHETLEKYVQDISSKLVTLSLMLEKLSKEPPKLKDEMNALHLSSGKMLEKVNLDLVKRVNELEQELKSKLDNERSLTCESFDKYVNKFSDFQRRFDDNDRRIELFYSQLTDEINRNKVVIDEEKIRLIVKKYKFQ